MPNALSFQNRGRQAFSSYRRTTCLNYIRCSMATWLLFLRIFFSEEVLYA